MIIRLYYVGEDYYNKSGTMMGVLYTKQFQRWDWGLVQSALKQDREVLISAATPDIIERADSELVRYV